MIYSLQTVRYNDVGTKEFLIVITRIITESLNGGINGKRVKSVRSQVCMYIYIYVCLCVHISTYAYMYVCTYMYLYVRVHTYILVFMYTVIHIHMFMI
jgi:hypothetical protein